MNARANNAITGVMHKNGTAMENGNLDITKVDIGSAVAE